MATKTFDSSGSTHYVTVTSDNTQVLAALNTLVIDLGQQADSTFWSNVESDGADIRIVDDSGTIGGSETAYSFTLINFSKSNQTGVLIFDASYLSTSSDTSFRIYVGDTSLTAPSNTDTLGRNNVWPSSAELIWPGDNAQDYTGNHTITKNGGITPGDVTGKVGPATEFDYSDDYLDTTASSSIPSSSYTVTAWMHSDGFGSSDRTIVGNYDGNGILARIESGDDYDLWHDSGSIEGGTLQTDQWIHVVYAFDGSNGQIYVDGAQVASGSLTQSDNGKDLRIGNTHDDRKWDGFLNQVRIYTRHWSQDEAKTQLNNHSDPANFWTASSTQAISKPVTVSTSALTTGIGLQDPTVKIADFSLSVDKADATFTDSVSVTVNASSLQLNLNEPNPAIKGSSSYTASALALSTSIQSPSYKIDTRPSVSNLSLQTSFIDPAVHIPVTHSASVLKTTTNLVDPTVRLPNVVVPSALQVNTNQIDPAIKGSSLYSASVLTASSDLQNTTVSAGVKTNASVFTLGSNLQDPDISTEEFVTIQPTVLGLNAKLIDPEYKIDSIFGVNTLSVSTNQPSPAVRIAKTISASSLSLSANVVSPQSIKLGVTAQPSVLVTSADNPDPVIREGAGVETQALVVTPNLQSPAIREGAGVDAAVLELAAAFQDETVRIDVSPTVSVLGVNTKQSDPAIRGGVGVDATVLTTSTNLPAPSVYLSVKPDVEPLVVNVRQVDPLIFATFWDEKDKGYDDGNFWSKKDDSFDDGNFWSEKQPEYDDGDFWDTKDPGY